MKKVIILLCLLGFGLSCNAEINERYKGMYFSSVYTDMYKRPVITWENHNKIVNYHSGAIQLCKDIGMRLPKKNEVDLLTSYINFSQSEYRRSISFWLYDNAVGQIGNVYIKDPTSNAYVLYYNSINRPIRTSLGTMNKTSGNASTVCTICVKEAPPMTFDERLKIFKDDYFGYQNGYDSFYKMVTETIQNQPLGLNYKLNKMYLEKVKFNLDEILALDFGAANYSFKTVSIVTEDQKKLSESTVRIINIYNELVTSDKL